MSRNTLRQIIREFLMREEDTDPDSPVTTTDLEVKAKEEMNPTTPQIKQSEIDNPGQSPYSADERKQMADFVNDVAMSMKKDGSTDEQIKQVVDKAREKIKA